MKQFFDILNKKEMFNYRFIQPPQIAYFVTTLDEFNNPNTTPVTLGTLNSANLPRGNRPSEFYFTFALGKRTLRDVDNYLKVRDGYMNLQKNQECVISYIPSSLVREATIANMPLPRGISEVEVAGLTHIDSQNIKTPSIKECPINIECIIENVVPIGYYYDLFVCKVVGLSVDKELIKKDTEGLGVSLIDPVFEINISRYESGNLRLDFGRLDLNKSLKTPDDFGSQPDWVGSFENWINSEFKRNKISRYELEKIVGLKSKFIKDRSNLKVKNELTNLLKKLVKENK